MSDIPSISHALDQKRQELARLEIELRQAQRQRLEGLATEMGFANTDELIIELTAFASSALAYAIRTRSSADRPESRLGSSPKARKSRAVVTNDMRARIAEELKAGSRTAAEIASQFNVSSSLVNQLKQKQGLTKKRNH